ncbi:MAG TPA: hypothetical protein VF631_11900 [Allosphingosinicella sp.]|jgi:hypothetical protein|uniref:hypothetical protein n=1 Tax=Allosphingosinicella sp. TaxID=2823234 RepID=UPI002F2A20CC
MRHEQLAAKDSFTKVDIAAVWPASGQIAPLPVLDIDEAPAGSPFTPTPAAADVPAAVGGLIVTSYAALLGSFALATVNSAQSAFMIAICGLFLVAYFTVPYLFFRQEPKAGPRPSLGLFLRQGMDTFTGRSTGTAALVQMLVVPVLLTFGALAMGVIAAIYL